MLLIQKVMTGASAIDWDTLSIPSLLGIVILALVWYIKKLFDDLKDKEKRINNLQDKMLENEQKHSSALIELNNEVLEQLNKLMFSWELFKRDNRNDTKQ